MDLKTGNKGKNMSSITLYHENVRNVTNKIDELRVTMHNNCIGPHFVCLTEHHLKEAEITNFPPQGYKLASYFCRKDHLGGGVCIYVKKDIIYQPVTLNHMCKEKSIDICAMKLHFKSLTLIILCIYRAPSGNLDLFLTTLNNILKHFLLPKVTYIVCGNLNINLLKKSHDTSNISSLMDSYNLTQVVDFPVRITNISETLIDTVFIDAAIYDKIQIQPIINGISGHDAQFLCLLNSNITLQQKSLQKNKN
jgi:exonuclease III